jgi:hypothetical protein
MVGRKTMIASDPGRAAYPARRESVAQEKSSARVIGLVKELESALAL